MARNAKLVYDATVLEAALRPRTSTSKNRRQVRHGRALLGKRRPAAAAAEAAPARRRRKLSSAARKRIAAAQKKRWADYRKSTKEE